MGKKPIVVKGDEIYFCLYLTENEHYIVEDQLREWCTFNSLSMKYYRKLKEGHWSCYREVKIVGKGAAHKVANYCREAQLFWSVELNPWREQEKEWTKF